MSAVTRVEICLFKPEGFADTVYVATEDRGLAVRTVMARYDAKMLSCINSVTANLCNPPNRESKDRIEANAPIIEPIGAEPRFFIGCDDDGHDYLVPLEQKEDWMAWEAHQSKDPDGMTEEEQLRAWTPPEYARRIDGWSNITFTDPKEP